jgi:hypothetical protein
MGRSFLKRNPWAGQDWLNFVMDIRTWADFWIKYVYIKEISIFFFFFIVL